MRGHHRLFWTFSALGIAGCGTVEVPDGVPCDGERVLAADAAAVAAAIGSGGAAECVVLAAGNYAGPFDVTRAGLTITSERGAAVVIEGNGSADAILRIGASGVRIAHLTIRGSTSRGVFIDDIPAADLTAVRIEDAQGPAVGIRCEDPSCLRSTGRVSMSGIEIAGSGSGIIVRGGRVSIQGTISGSRTQGLTGGGGLYVLAGADVTLTGATLRDNVYGVVVDGASTRISITDSAVEENGEAGIWAQGVRGTMAAPAVQIGGSRTRIAKNAITGLGAFDAQGIHMSGGEIVETVQKAVQIDLVNRPMIGDGIGLFSSSSEVLVEGASLARNERAQAIVDTAGGGIQFGATNMVSAAGNQHKVVVQNSTAMVSVPAGDQSHVMPLPIRALALGLP